MATLYRLVKVKSPAKKKARKTTRKRTTKRRKC
jgi:hypothetical protein